MPRSRAREIQAETPGFKQQFSIRGGINIQCQRTKSGLDLPKMLLDYLNKQSSKFGDKQKKWSKEDRKIYETAEKALRKFDSESVVTAIKRFAPQGAKRKEVLIALSKVF